MLTYFKHLNYNNSMKLTLQIKLLPDKEQSASLLATIKRCNAACNAISSTAWDNRVFNQFKVHNLAYKSIKDAFELSAQMVVRCISKVADAYKLDKKTKREFKPLGAITYDSRILSYRAGTPSGHSGMTVSLWSVDGRLKKVPFVCHNKNFLPYIKGEADLVTRKGKYYLFQTVEVPEDDIRDVEEFIGVDFGVTDIATMSDGTNFGSESLNKIRDKYFKTRRSVQRKGTQGAKKLLKRLQGREQRHAAITNHTISKQIVSEAKAEGKGIAIEALSGIRERTTVRKSQRRRHHSWAFAQLRSFIEYKARIAGIPVAVIDPRYTSKTCNVCKYIGDRQGKSFTCPSCGNIADADVNAARNIAQMGMAVTHPEKSLMYSRLMHSPLECPVF